MPSTQREEPGAAARLLQIGEVAERVGLSLRTVRFYEEAGLVTPAKRSEGNFRLYAEEQVERLLLIKQMKPLGFTVEQMRELLEAHDALADAGTPAAARGEAAERIAAFAAFAEASAEKLRVTAEHGFRFAADLRDAARERRPMPSRSTPAR
jgi:DNA-binding transcriptional MerR regulator